MSIHSGLPYFGGKSIIGRYLANHIFNMAERMYFDNRKADIFIDAFAGGGKMTLSMPRGWFDKIVLNELNFGVYNYFRYCGENPEALIEMIGQLGTVMSEEFFKFCVYYRDEKNCYNNAKVTPLVSAAMTYWVTHMSYLAIVSVAGASYLKFGTETEERNKIRNVAINAKKTVNTVHYRMKQLNVVVENLDYRQLIKKYNGKKYQPYADKEYNKTEGILAKSNKLWYFDPPYHPVTISDYKDNEDHMRSR